MTLLRHIPLQFAIGLSIDRKTPYTWVSILWLNLSLTIRRVKQVYEALDQQNEIVGSMISIGDIVEKVDGRPAVSITYLHFKQRL